MCGPADDFKTIRDGSSHGCYDVCRNGRDDDNVLQGRYCQGYTRAPPSISGGKLDYGTCRIFLGPPGGLTCEKGTAVDYSTYFAAPYFTMVREEGPAPPNPACDGVADSGPWPCVGADASAVVGHGGNVGGKNCVLFDGTAATEVSCKALAIAQASNPDACDSPISTLFAAYGAKVPASLDAKKKAREYCGASCAGCTPTAATAASTAAPPPPRPSHWAALPPPPPPPSLPPVKTAGPFFGGCAQCTRADANAEEVCVKAVDFVKYSWDCKERQAVVLGRRSECKEVKGCQTICEDIPEHEVLGGRICQGYDNGGTGSNKGTCRLYLGPLGKVPLDGRTPVVEYPSNRLVCDKGKMGDTPSLRRRTCNRGRFSTTLLDSTVSYSILT